MEIKEKEELIKLVDKYLEETRQKRKGGIEDIKKAKWCLDKYFELN